MAILLSSTFKDISRRKKLLTGSGTVSGNYTPGGSTVDLSTVQNPKMISNGKIAAQPERGIVISGGAGYPAELIPGATLKTWLLKVSSAPGNELGAVAFPAAVIADPFVFEFSGKLGAM